MVGQIEDKPVVFDDTVYFLGFENYDETKKPEDPKIHYYRLMKQLTLVGFLTSETGVKKAMRHVPIPGRFDPCIPCEPGDKVWA